MNINYKVLQVSNQIQIIKMGLPDSVDDPNELFSKNSSPVIHNHHNNSSDESDPDINQGDQYNGYAPLGHDGGAGYQNNHNLNDADHNGASDDEDEAGAGIEIGDFDDLGECANNGFPDVISPETEIECEVWNAPRPNELNIELDSTKTQQVTPTI